MGVGTYNYNFKSEVFESVKVKSVKIIFFSETLGWSKKSFVRRFENYTFESVFFKSVEIESVVVSAHPQRKVSKSQIGKQEKCHTCL